MEWSLKYFLFGAIIHKIFIILKSRPKLVLMEVISMKCYSIILSALFLSVPVRAVNIGHAKTALCLGAELYSIGLFLEGIKNLANKMDELGVVGVLTKKEKAMPHIKMFIRNTTLLTASSVALFHDIKKSNNQSNNKLSDKKHTKGYGY